MESIYFKTGRLIRRQGNLVDLAAYRRRLAAVSGGDGPPASGGGRGDAGTPPPLRVLPPAPRRRRGRRGTAEGLARALDLCVSLAIVVMTLSAVVGFLRL